MKQREYKFVGAGPVFAQPQLNDQKTVGADTSTAYNYCNKIKDFDNNLSVRPPTENWLKLCRGGACSARLQRIY